MALTEIAALIALFQHAIKVAVSAPVITLSESVREPFNPRRFNFTFRLFYLKVYVPLVAFVGHFSKLR
jgi:hypothetical protein